MTSSNTSKALEASARTCAPLESRARTETKGGAGGGRDRGRGRGRDRAGKGEGETGGRERAIYTRQTLEQCAASMSLAPSTSVMRAPSERRTAAAVATACAEGELGTVCVRVCAIVRGRFY